MRVQVRLTESSKCRFELGKARPMRKIEDPLRMTLALMKSIHGSSVPELKKYLNLNKRDRSCTIDVGTSVGREIAGIVQGIIGGGEVFVISRGASSDEFIFIQ